MLELRPSCECCDKDLPPAATDAMICTFECTFCRDCVNEKLNANVPIVVGILRHVPSGLLQSSRSLHLRPSGFSIRKAVVEPPKDIEMQWTYRCW